MCASQVSNDQTNPEAPRTWASWAPICVRRGTHRGGGGYERGVKKRKTTQDEKAGVAVESVWRRLVPQAEDV